MQQPCAIVSSSTFILTVQIHCDQSEKLEYCPDSDSENSFPEIAARITLVPALVGWHFTLRLHRHAGHSMLMYLHWKRYWFYSFRNCSLFVFQYLFCLILLLWLRWKLNWMCIHESKELFEKLFSSITFFVFSDKHMSHLPAFTYLCRVIIVQDSLKFLFIFLIKHFVLLTQRAKLFG